MHGVQAMTMTTMLSFIFSQLSQLYNSKARKLHFVLLLICLLQLIFHQFEHQPGYHWFIYFQCMCCIKLYLFPPWRVFWFEVPPALQKFQLNFILYMYILLLRFAIWWASILIFWNPKLVESLEVVNYRAGDGKLWCPSSSSHPQRVSTPSGQFGVDYCIMSNRGEP